MYTQADKEYFESLSKTHPKIHEFISAQVANHRNDLHLGCHSLRNVLSYIYGNAQLVELQIPELKTNFRWMQMYASIEHAISFMNDVNLYRYADVLHPEHIDFLTYFMHWKQGIAQNPALCRLTIIESIDTNPSLIIDKKRMSIALNALLQNAADEDPRTVIHLTVSSCESHALTIQIRYEGAAFSEDVLKHLFHPFTTTKTEHSGLGLSIAYRTVIAHGGSLHYTREHGSNCFIIKLNCKDKIFI